MKFWMETVIEEVDEPQRIFERGRGGRLDRVPIFTVWELTEGAGRTTEAKVTFWTEPANPFDRMRERGSHPPLVSPAVGRGARRASRSSPRPGERDRAGRRRRRRSPLRADALNRTAATMNRAFPLAILLVLALRRRRVAAGCGEEEELHVIEGEPLELGELRYNVQITRFLNPDDPEDQGYLVGQEPPEPGRGLSRRSS